MSDDFLGKAYPYDFISIEINGVFATGDGKSGVFYTLVTPGAVLIGIAYATRALLARLGNGADKKKELTENNSG